MISAIFIKPLGSASNNEMNIDGTKSCYFEGLTEEAVKKYKFFDHVTYFSRPNFGSGLFFEWPSLAVGGGRPGHPYSSLYWRWLITNHCFIASLGFFYAYACAGSHFHIQLFIIPYHLHCSANVTKFYSGTVDENCFQHS